MKNSTIPVIVAILMCSGPAPAHAQTKYVFKDLSAEIGLTNVTLVSMNASGAVAGTGQFPAPGQLYNGEIHAFMYDGFMHDLGTISGTRSEAYAINASGKVVGRSSGSRGGLRAVLYDGGAHDLGSPGDSGAYAINSKGEVTGFLFVSLTDPNSVTPYSTQRAFFYDGKTMKDLSPIVGNDTVGMGIDDSGRILIQAPGKALLYEDGTATDIGSLGGGNTKAAAMSTTGKAVGSSKTDKNEIHAFLWDGAMHDLGVLPDRVRSEARAVNSSGTVVGISMAGRGRQQDGDHAFVYEDSKMTDLNDLLVGDHIGLVFIDAVAINDQGAIVASSNKHEYYLLTPATGAEIKADEARIAAIPPPVKAVIPNGNISGSGAKIDRSGTAVTLSFTDLNGEPQTYTVERPGFAAAMLAGRDDGGWMHISEDGTSGTMFNVSASGGVSGSPANPMMLKMMRQQQDAN